MSLHKFESVLIITQTAFDFSTLKTRLPINDIQSQSIRNLNEY